LSLSASVLGFIAAGEFPTSFSIIISCKRSDFYRETVRTLIWRDGNGSWNGGQIPGTVVYSLDKDTDGLTVYPYKMIEAKNIFERLRWEGKVMRIDHPDKEPYLYYCITKGSLVGVIKGW
jgi:hypothetical protein